MSTNETETTSVAPTPSTEDFLVVTEEKSPDTTQGAQSAQGADIILLLDESGSMQSMGKEPIQAVNKFISKQKDTAPASLFSLYTFSDNHRKIIEGKPLSEVQEYTDYKPDGMTALYDTIFTAVDDKMKTDRKFNVVFVILTDGQDNSSTKTKNDVKELIARQEKDYNWQVIYLASNHDAFSVGASMNVSNYRACNFNQQKKGDLLDLIEEKSAHISSFRLDRHSDRMDRCSAQINLHSVPTNRSQPNNSQVDRPSFLNRVKTLLSTKP